MKLDKVFLFAIALFAVGIWASAPSTYAQSSPSSSQTGGSYGSSSSGAGQYGSSSSTSASSPSSQKQYTGTISSIDRSTNSVTVKTSDGQERKFSVNSSTKYNMGATGQKFSDLQEGQQVSITANGDKAMSFDNYTGSSTGSTPSSSGSGMGTSGSSGTGASPSSSGSGSTRY